MTPLSKYAPPALLATAFCMICMAFLSPPSSQAQAPTWSVQPSDFEFDMQVIAELHIGGTRSDHVSNIIGAFVGGEIRGVGTPIMVSGEAIYLFTIFGDIGGETVTFKAYDAAADEVKDVAESMSFQDGDIEGTLSSPVVLNAVSASGSPPDWAVEPSDFEFDMQVIAELHIDGTRSDHLSNVIGAFVGLDLRGVGTPQMVSGKALYLFTIFGDTDGETVTFKAYDAAADEVKDVAETISFEDGDIVGSLSSPFVLNAGAVDDDNTPEWEVDPNDFEFDMQVIGVLHIDNVLSNHPGNIVGAFAGTEVRGVATSVDVGGTRTFFLSIFASGDGEVITFKAYDAAADEVKSISESIVFTSNLTEGTISDPFIWNTGAAMLTCSLGAGWDWFSINVIPDDASLGAVLSGLTLASNDLIKNTDTGQFSQWDGTHWLGTLAAIDPGDGYKINLTHQSSLSLSGPPVGSSLSVVSGWNLIGFAPQASESVTDALSSLSLTTGDLVKGDAGDFSEFNAGWLGSLTMLDPCEGYMLRVANAGTLSLLETAPEPRAGDASAILRGAATGAQSVDPAHFEHSMSIVGSVDRGAVATVAAYVDGEIRGVSDALSVHGAHRFFLSVYGRFDGEEITFKAFDSDGAEIGLSGALKFEVDAVHGTSSEPVVWPVASSVSSGDEAVPVEYALEANYPNPFNPTTRIEYALPQAGMVRLIIYDVAGREVRRLVNETLPAGRHAVEWNGLDDGGRPAASGLYIYRLQAGSFEDVRKMVIIK